MTYGRTPWTASAALTIIAVTAGAILGLLMLATVSNAASNAYCQGEGPRPGRIVINSINAHRVPGGTTCSRTAVVARKWLYRQPGTPKRGKETGLTALGRAWSCLADDEYLPFGRRGFASLRVRCSPFAGPTVDATRWIILVAVTP